MPAEAVARVLDLYGELGGANSPLVVLRPGSWDIVLADGLVVELDEEQHFNRYRALTLGPPWTDALPWASAYRRYAAEREPESLRKAKGGGYWTSPSTQGMFGDADPPGVFEPNGSPRWKQRALYDAMRDALAASGGVRLARVAVWDVNGESTLGRVLDGRAEPDHDELAALVELRTS